MPLGLYSRRLRFRIERRMRLDQILAESPMSDLLMVTMGLFFFALMLGYAYACARL